MYVIVIKRFFLHVNLLFVVSKVLIFSWCLKGIFLLIFLVFSRQLNDVCDIVNAIRRSWNCEQMRPLLRQLILSLRWLSIMASDNYDITNNGKLSFGV